MGVGEGIDAAARTVWVVIPAHNEAGTVQAVVSGARAHGCRVVVVDDGSGDATADQARTAGATVLSLAVSLGAWGATQTGLRYALNHGADMVVTMDADGQHLPEELPALVRALAAGADVVVGASPARASWQRRLAWSYLRALSGAAVQDLTSGFRGYGRRAVRVLVGREAMLLNYQDVGVLLLLSRNGFLIEEVPVRMAERSDGGSRIFRSWWWVGVYMIESTVLGLSSGLWRQRLRRALGR
jgi:glycosyltransferase involved in cell wall biosynthesis